MKAAPFDYVAPKTVAEASASLASNGATTVAIAGGQSLLPMLNLRVVLPDLLVDIGGLQELKEVAATADTIRIGALTTHAAIEDGKLPDSLLVSDRAIGTNQTSRYLLVVDKDNTVQERQVEIGVLVNGMRVITKGITADDWVVADGIQRAIPGSKVNPQRVKAPPVAAEAAPAPIGAAKTGSGQ